MKTASPSIFITHGKGVYLYAEGGKRYIDGISSWWVNLHGHAHPTIAERISSQAKELEHVVFAGFTHKPAEELATRLLSLLPKNLNKIFYSDNGSTAVEVALKMALQYFYNQDRPKKKIICFKNSYHGDTFGAMSTAGKNGFNRPFWSHLFEVEVIDPPLKGKEDEVEKQFQSLLSKEDVACFIFEPLILGSGGMILYSKESLDRLINLCKKYEVITIADEVMTGFGRLDSLFASEQLQEKPDIICLAKGLTGGFLPLGATIASEKIYQAFLSDNLTHALLHGHSYTANPLACASALASLELLLEDRTFHQRRKIAECHRIFCQNWKNHPKLKRCDCIGTILVLEYATNSSYFNPFRDTLYHFFLEKGILLRPLGNVLYVLPPYCIEVEELIYIYDHIITTLKEKI